MDAAVKAVNALMQKTSAAQRQLELALQKATFDVAHARRQYDAVDPANRLVAGELERRWNAALEVKQKIENDIAALLAYPGEILELGRSCVDAGYRARSVMQLLWGGISAYVSPYDIALKPTVFHASKTPLRQGSYRALAATANHYAREMHMDEMARAIATASSRFIGISRTTRCYSPRRSRGSCACRRPGRESMPTLFSNTSPFSGCPIL